MQHAPSLSSAISPTTPLRTRDAAQPLRRWRSLLATITECVVRLHRDRPLGAEESAVLWW